MLLTEEIKQAKGQADNAGGPGGTAHCPRVEGIGVLGLHSFVKIMVIIESLSEICIKIQENGSGTGGRVEGKKGGKEFRRPGETGEGTRGKLVKGTVGNW